MAPTHDGPKALDDDAISGEIGHRAIEVFRSGV